MKKLFLLSFLICLGFALPASNGPVLTVTGTGAPGSTVDFAVTQGTPDAMIAIFWSVKNDGFTLTTPCGDIEFGIGPKIFPVDKGKVDQNGEFTTSITLPNYPPQYSGTVLYFQAVEMVHSGHHQCDFNTSNVESLTLQ